MERSEFPSAQILRDLRAEGKVPYSAVTTRAAVTAGTLAGLYWAATRLSAKDGAVALLLEKGPAGSSTLFETASLQPIALCLLAPVFGAVAGWMLSWAGQTRCLFLPGVGMSTDAGLLGSAPETETGQVAVARKVLVAILAVAAAAAFWFRSVQEWGIVLREGADFLAEMVPRYVPLLLGPLCVALLGIGLLTHLVARIVFMFKHRVTRADVLRDL